MEIEGFSAALRARAALRRGRRDKAEQALADWVFGGDPEPSEDEIEDAEVIEDE